MRGFTRAACTLEAAGSAQTAFDAPVFGVDALLLSIIYGELFPSPLHGNIAAPPFKHSNPPRRSHSLHCVSPLLSPLFLTSSILHLLILLLVSFLSCLVSSLLISSSSLLFIFSSSLLASSPHVISFFVSFLFLPFHLFSP